MEFFEGIRAGKLPPAPIGETLDFVAICIEPGSVVFQGRPQRRHYNPLGTVHGGWFVTLVRALTDKVPVIRAEGKLLHAGRQVATAEGRIVGPDGKLYAHASTTCLIFDHPPPHDQPLSK